MLIESVCSQNLSHFSSLTNKFNTWFTVLGSNTIQNDFCIYIEDTLNLLTSKSFEFYYLLLKLASVPMTTLQMYHHEEYSYLSQFKFKYISYLDGLIFHFSHSGFPTLLLLWFVWLCEGRQVLSCLLVRPLVARSLHCSALQLFLPIFLILPDLLTVIFQCGK